jgi:hypothetical protein
VQEDRITALKSGVMSITHKVELVDNTVVLQDVEIILTGVLLL